MSKQINNMKKEMSHLIKSENSYKTQCTNLSEQIQELMKNASPHEPPTTAMADSKLSCELSMVCV